MILKRFYNDYLSQASFLVGCGQTKEAIVIDPTRHADDYMRAAANEGLRIVAVTETHIHADYLSGSRELARRTGATLYLSDEGDADWKYVYADEPNVRLVQDGDAIRVGKVRFDVLRTPGHTPEHVCFQVVDEATAPEALGVFTGDFIFVGDVGRPDLLERAANIQGTMEKGARQLYQSLSHFKSSSPNLILWPGHGAGSACGKALGGVPVSTLAYESAANWALRCPSEAEFVEHVLEGQPEPPLYFKEMKMRNKQGPALLGAFRAPVRLAGPEIFGALEGPGIVIDVRAAGEVATGYVPGTHNVPLGKAFVNWCGWIVPYDTPIFLIANNEAEATEAARALALIGLDDVQGWFGMDGWRTYEDRCGALPVISQSSMPQALEAAKSGTGRMLDVRTENEFQTCRIPGVQHLSLGYLKGRVSDVPRDLPVYVFCGGGVRSAIAASILMSAGAREVVNIPGGFYEYRQLGLPIESGVRQNVPA